jgi:hypothetical protein
MFHPHKLKKSNPKDIALSIHLPETVTKNVHCKFWDQDHSTRNQELRNVDKAENVFKDTLLELK